jgi:hypothetical protein
MPAETRYTSMGIAVKSLGFNVLRPTGAKQRALSENYDAYLGMVKELRDYIERILQLGGKPPTWPSTILLEASAFPPSLPFPPGSTPRTNVGRELLAGLLCGLKGGCTSSSLWEGQPRLLPLCYKPG